MTVAAGALVVRVPQAEALVADLRRRRDASAVSGMDAHVTVMARFMAPDNAGGGAGVQRLGAALSALPAFDVRRVRVDRFPRAAGPGGVLRAADAGGRRGVPGLAASGGAQAGVVPNLTVADGEAAAADAAAADAAERTLPQRLGAAGRCSAAARQWTGWRAAPAAAVGERAT